MIKQTKAHFTLAELIAGLNVEIKGDPKSIITGIATIQDAWPGDLAFLVNPIYKKHLETTQATAVILSPADAELCPKSAIIARNPYYIYAKIAAFFSQKSPAQAGVHPSVSLGKHCEIDPSASIGANCFIDDGVKLDAHVVIGPNCVIGEYSEIAAYTQIDANVTLYDRIIIGKHVHISSGTVIGSDGFGLANEQGLWLKVPQLGRVILEDHVEIGSNCSIDRGAIGDTVLEKGVKLDNLIQVAHNVRIGQNTAIAACVGISGSTEIGKNCLIGGAAAFAGHLIIADNVVVTGGSEITKSIRTPGVYSSGVGGVVTNMEKRKNTARLHRLDRLMDRVKALESALHKLTERK